MGDSIYDSRHGELIRRLREARQKQGLSQEEIAEYLELPQSVVSRLESGQRKVSAIELRDLSELLGIPMDQLVPRRGWK